MPQVELTKKYIDFIRNETGIDIQLKHKDNSFLMKLLSWFFSVTKINPSFKDKYFTTVGKTIYYPSHSEVLTEEQFFIVILHEVMHVIDYKHYSFLYILAYLFPQWLALVALILGFITSAWWFLGLAFLAPLPAFGRFWFEIRAFRTSLVYYILKNFSTENKELLTRHVTEQMTKSFYYYAWPFPNHVVKIFTNQEALKNEKSYELIAKFLKQNS